MEGSANKVTVDDVGRDIARMLLLELRGKGHLAQTIRQRLLRVIRRRLKDAPSAEWWNLLADTYARPSDALRAFREVLAIDPVNGEALVGASDACHLLDDHVNMVTYALAAMQVGDAEVRKRAADNVESALSEMGVSYSLEAARQPTTSESQDREYDLSELLQPDALELREAMKDGSDAGPAEGSFAFKLQQDAEKRDV